MGQRVRITEYLDIDIDNEMWCCNRCGDQIIGARKNYKEGCLVYDRDPSDIYKPVTHEEYDFTPDASWCRLVEFYCPSCGTMIEVEVLPPSHPLTYDIELDLDALSERMRKGEAGGSND